MNILLTLCVLALTLNQVECVEQNLTCFSSDHPAAWGITKVYDFDNDDENLWEKLSQSSCNVTILTSFNHCCPDIHGSIRPEKVYVFCHNLTGSERLKMEDSQRKIIFNKTDCPSAPTPPAPENQPGQLGPLHITLIVLTLIIIVVVVVVVVVYRRSKANQNLGSEKGPGQAKNGTNGAPLLQTRNGLTNM